MNFKKEANKGITLIALVITIIILLILAGISIAMLTGENGLIGRAQSATKDYDMASIKEQIQMEILGKTDNSLNIANADLEAILDKYGDVTYEEDGTTPKGVKPEKYQDEEILLADLWRGTTVTPKEETEIIGDGSDSSVNTPKLSGMTPIIFNETTGQASEATTEKEWYSYIAQSGTTENGGTSHWANAMTADGSMWVWIPRYTYKILSNEHTNIAGEIDIKFSDGTNDDTSGGYKLHPAFTFGTQQLTGIWVAKFEMSCETSGVASMLGNVATEKAGGTSGIAMVSKPNVSSWKNITVSNIFTNTYHYDRAKDSHMMKNVEWGACAYLTHSKYGRNKTKVTVNNNSSYMTGYGGNAVSNANKWTGKKGKLASTTGNIYGIYDMSGGSWEYVSRICK